jgi:ABC-2 type transport system ATP-binding protein
MTAAVVADDLRKTYGDTVALDGVSLAVEPGEVFALIGPNGAGKTTLVRCLTGTTRPDSGSARLLDASPAAVSKERIGLLPQAFAPAERLTARELVRYYAGLYESARAPDDALDAVGLDDRHTRYENLSGGQQRRACVAATVVNDPEVLFLDEPTTGIDPAGSRAVRRVVDRLVEQGTTVVLTTHDMAEAERLADRVALLDDGEVVATGTPADLVADHGGGSRLRIETTTPDAAAALADDFAARAVSDGVVVTDVGPGDIGAVVRALDDRGVAFDSLTWREPGLEDVYLALAESSPAEGVTG